MSDQRVPAALESIVTAFRYQRDGITTSPLYQRLLGVTIDDVEAGGICADVLRQTPAGVEPVLDALPLRFLGAVHHLVLDGHAPGLARRYPSAGGHFDGDDPASDPADDFLATVSEHRDAIVTGLGRGVQTNEVGRCASLLPGFLDVAGSTGLPLRILEIGASAGLNLRWDHYRYEGGANGSAWGDADSALTFTGAFVEPLVDLDVPAHVAERRGCDRSPIDASTREGSQLLRSFVWPDQLDRLRALDAALSIAAAVPVVIDHEDAGEWVVDQLAEPVAGVATVVFQSIVWQYLPKPTRTAIKETIRAAGARATGDAPLAWLRMEPGVEPTKGAEVRLATWPSGDDRVLARTGYHGPPVMLLRDGD